MGRQLVESRQRCGGIELAEVRDVPRTHRIDTSVAVPLCCLPPGGSQTELGGAGVDLLDGMLLVEQVAAVDGSMGWIFEIRIGGLVRLGFLPLAQARELANQPRAFVAGTFPPLGRATVVPGGFVVSGRWPFASGIHQATWVAAGCVVYEDGVPATTPDGGPRAPR